MAEETITILKVGTEEAVRSINDLKSNIKTLKDSLGDLEVGTEEYQETLEELKVNQNALKDAMYATSSSMEDVAKAATGASESYNSLVHRMAALKEEFRATDDVVRRSQLGAQINQINSQLKEMDALQGNFQRNVGNYEGALKSWSSGFDAMDKGLKAAKGGINGLKGAADALQASPTIATFSIIVSIVMQLAEKLKENENVMASIKKLMEKMKPVMDVVTKVIEVIAEWVSKAVDYFADLMTGSGDTFKNIIAGAVGVGNVLVQFLLTPIRTAITSIKALGQALTNVFNGNWSAAWQNAKDAIAGIGEAYKKGFSFKANFDEGKRVGEEFLAGLGSSETKNKAKKTGQGVAKEVTKEVESEFDKMLKAIDKKIEESNAKYEAAYKRRQAFRKEMQDVADADFKDFQDSLNNEIEQYLEAQDELEKASLAKAKETAKAKKDLMKGVASATSDILGAIADLYDSDEENSEKNANKIKNLRIAAATIDTISGAIGAFMQASQTIPPPYGQIVGAAAAAAVTASGLAQIAQLRKTKVSGDSANTNISTPAVANAPTINPNVTNVRSLTSASEEDRLNRMARDQRVYILSSDIEASQDQIKTQVSESSF